MSTRLRRVRDWLALAASSRYNAADLARSVGVSLRQLERHFQRRGSCPPQEWLYRVRIWVAGQRLLEGEPHKVVASELNFKDIAHFYHQFRRYHGMTPTGFVDKVYLGLDDSRFLPDGTLAVKQVDDEGVRDALGRLTQPLRAGRPAKVSAGEAVSPPADSFRP